MTMQQLEAIALERELEAIAYRDDIKRLLAISEIALEAVRVAGLAGNVTCASALQKIVALNKQWTHKN